MTTMKIRRDSTTIFISLVTALCLTLSGPAMASLMVIEVTGTAHSGSGPDGPWNTRLTKGFIENGVFVRTVDGTVACVEGSGTMKSIGPESLARVENDALVPLSGKLREKSGSLLSSIMGYLKNCVSGETSSVEAATASGSKAIDKLENAITESMKRKKSAPAKSRVEIQAVTAAGNAEVMFDKGFDMSENFGYQQEVMKAEADIATTRPALAPADEKAAGQFHSSQARTPSPATPPSEMASQTPAGGGSTPAPVAGDAPAPAPEADDGSTGPGAVATAVVQLPAICPVIPLTTAISAGPFEISTGEAILLLPQGATKEISVFLKTSGVTNLVYRGNFPVMDGIGQIKVSLPLEEGGGGCKMTVKALVSGEPWASGVVLQKMDARSLDEIEAVAAELDAEMAGFSLHTRLGAKAALYQSRGFLPDALGLFREAAANDTETPSLFETLARALIERMKAR